MTTMERMRFTAVEAEKVQDLMSRRQSVIEAIDYANKHKKTPWMIIPINEHTTVEEEPSLDLDPAKVINLLETELSQINNQLFRLGIEITA